MILKDRYYGGPTFFWDIAAQRWMSNEDIASMNREVLKDSIDDLFGGKFAGMFDNALD